MGLARVEQIAARLVAHGAAASTPAAVIAQGTLQDQRVVTGTLATIAAVAAASDIQSPALLIVGEVVSLHASLAWFNPGAAAAPAEVSQSA
jgi:uroporphyrin-III C-methyltransferase/precorrin-2 dehydrogenase/sirohydrochlorin ferrochelatase